MLTLPNALTAPDLLQPERWVDHLADGTVVLLDPATGERLGKTYAWIEESPYLQVGHDFLRRAGSQLSAYVTGGVHYEMDAARLGPDFESNVWSHDAFGFEGFGWHRQEYETEIMQLRATGKIERRFSRLHRMKSGSYGLLRPAPSPVFPMTSRTLRNRWILCFWRCMRL